MWYWTISGIWLARRSRVIYKYKLHSNSNTKLQLAQKSVFVTRLSQIMSLHAKDELTLSSLKVYCVYLSAFFQLFHINVKGQGNVNVTRRLFLEDYLEQSLFFLQFC